MVKGFPDGTRAVTVVGQCEGEFVTIATDESGHLYALMRAEDGEGQLHALRVDDSGRIIAVPRGNSGYYLAVDDAGNLSAVVKGQDTEGVLHPVRIDSAGQIVMVPRGESGYYLNVDADGYLCTLLKGEWEGGLRTVKLDSEGRISAFVVDSVDAWGRMLQIGNAEVAVRLGSAVRYDRRGQVVFMSDFSSGWRNWSRESVGSGGYTELSPDWWESGGYSAHLVCASDSDQIVKLYTHVTSLPPGRIGWEVTFSFGSAVLYLDFYLRYYSGQEMWEGRSRCYTGPGPFRIYDGQGGGHNLFYPGFMANAPGYFHTAKLVIDVENTCYGHVLCDQYEMDCSQCSVLRQDQVGMSYLYGEITVAGSAGSHNHIYIDRAILTASE